MSNTSELVASPVYCPELKRALRKADSLSFDFDDDTVTLRLYKRASDVRDPFDAAERTILFRGFRGRVASGYYDRTRTCPDNYVEYAKSDDNSYSPRRGTWSIVHYQFSHPVVTAFACAPLGATLEFRVLLDQHTNSYCARASLHADVLIMEVRKGKLHRQFVLDSVVGAHNTARFGFPG